MPNNKKEALTKYLNKFLKKGYSEDTLRSYLKKKGYSDSAISSSMSKTKKPLQIQVPHLGKTWIPVGVVAAVIVIAIIVLSFVPLLGGCGYDKACFIDAANRCEAATVREDLEGSTILYRSTEDCVITKEFEDFSKAEPEEIMLLFKGKEMACAYERNSFPEEFVSLVGGIELCDGELKDSIYELRLAQIALS